MTEAEPAVAGFRLAERVCVCRSKGDPQAATSIGVIESAFVAVAKLIGVAASSGTDRADRSVEREGAPTGRRLVEVCGDGGGFGCAPTELAPWDLAARVPNPESAGCVVVVVEVTKKSDDVGGAAECRRERAIGVGHLQPSVRAARSARYESVGRLDLVGIWQTQFVDIAVAHYGSPAVSNEVFRSVLEVIAAAAVMLTMLGHRVVGHDLGDTATACAPRMRSGRNHGDGATTALQWLICVKRRWDCIDCLSWVNLAPGVPGCRNPDSVSHSPFLRSAGVCLLDCTLLGLNQRTLRATSQI